MKRSLGSLLLRWTKPESGQAIVLIALAIVGLVGFAALAIDGGRLFFAQRDAQNGADAAMLAATSAYCRGGDFTAAGLAAALANGYDNDIWTNIVSINNPPLAGPAAGDSDFIEATIWTEVGSNFAHLVFQGDLEVTVRAVGQCTPAVTDINGAALWANNQYCNNTADTTGSGVHIVGGVHTNNELLVGGSADGLIIEGDTTYVGRVKAPDGKITYVPDDYNPLQVPVQPMPVLFNIEDFDSASDPIPTSMGPNYVYYDGTMNKAWLEAEGKLVDGVITEGLYFATGGIDLKNVVGKDDAVSTITLVSPGPIQFSGSGVDIRPYYMDLLIFSNYDVDALPGKDKCNVNAIKISTSDVEWWGIIYAPEGGVEMSASDNTTLHGSIIADTFNLSGSNIYIVSTLFPANNISPPIVEIVD